MGLAFRLMESGVSGIITPSPPAADMTRESRLVRESLIEVSVYCVPIGVAETRAAKYFSCSTLEDVTCSDPGVEPVDIFNSFISML